MRWNTEVNECCPSPPDLRNMGFFSHIKTHKNAHLQEYFSSRINFPFQYRFTRHCARGHWKGAVTASGRTPASDKTKASACPPSSYCPRFSQSAATSSLRGASLISSSATADGLCLHTVHVGSKAAWLLCKIWHLKSGKKLQPRNGKPTHLPGLLKQPLALVPTYSSLNSPSRFDSL